MTRYAVGAVMAAHGVVHLIGFVVPWRLADVEGSPYRTTVLAGAADLGDAGARLVGIVWLACALGFVVAAVGIARRTPWAAPLSAALAALSLVVCVLGLPGTAAGIAVNLAILAGVAWSARARVTHAPTPHARAHTVEVGS